MKYIIIQFVDLNWEFSVKRSYKLSMLKKLPQVFKANQSLLKIALQVQKSSCMTSSLCYKNLNTNKYYLIHKNQYAPLIMEDWQAYNIMRGWCDILFNTGSTLRVQKNVFLDYVSLGNPAIDQFFKICHGQNSQKGKQWCYFATKSMQRNQLLQYVNEKCFKLMNGLEEMSFILKQSGYNGQKDQDINLPKLVNSLLKHHKAKFVDSQIPSSILLQFGTTLFHKYWAQVEENLKNMKQGETVTNQQNPLDLIFLSVFQGKIDEKCIGSQLCLKTQQYYKQIWRSQAIILNYPQKNLDGKINFILYKRI